MPEEPEVEGHNAVAPKSAPNLGMNDGSMGEWYFQEETTGQPAGPWNVDQLRTRWRHNQINGFTPIWRQGLDSWKALAEVPELKAALQEAPDSEVDESGFGVDGNGEPIAVGGSAKRWKRTVLEEVPLTHTYTSEQGVLYVYDTVDGDWKASDVYEALLREEEEVEKRMQKLAARETAEAVIPNARMSEVDDLPPDAQEALKELLADVVDAGGPATSIAGSQVLGAVAGSKRAAPATAIVADAGSFPETQPPSDEKMVKRLKRRDYRERRKLKKQAGIFMKAQDNPNVYVSGLPPDVTVKELEAVMKRAGVLKVDLETGDAKIRLYLDSDGSSCKGDALVSYANDASVRLALEFLHEFELRPQCRIAVQQADFEEHDHELRLSKAKLRELASKKQKDCTYRAKYIAAKNAQKEAVSWSGEMDDGTGRRIVVLRHLFSAEEAEHEGAEFYAELADEVGEECKKIGEVVKVTPIERHRQGIVCVKFKCSSEAEECIRVMDGRYFAGRTVEASFYDGKTDLRALGMAAEPARPPLLAPEMVQAAATAAPIEAKAVPAAPGPEASAAQATHARQAAGAADGPVEEVVATLAGAAAAAPGPPGAMPQPDQQAKTWEEWLDGQSSDSDSETRIHTEG